jgi:hypothetical protein
LGSSVSVSVCCIMMAWISRNANDLQLKTMIAT